LPRPKSIYPNYGLLLIKRIDLLGHIARFVIPSIDWVSTDAAIAT
jgi:hypothetical protein